MKSRMIWRDMTRNRTVTLTVFLFIAAAAALLSLAAMLGVSLFGSIDRLMADARTPHFMQMHAGKLDRKRLETFAAEYDGVTHFQVLNFLGIDSAHILVNGRSLVGTLQDNGFCTQSGQFDFLLDLDNRPVQPVEGELYVPVFYRGSGAIKAGDTVVINGVRLTVAGFVRDAQMNSALAYSKRFVVNAADYARLEPFGALEYLIEYRLRQLSDLGRFSAAYSAAGLPAGGPTLTWPLFRILSALSDGMLIGVILLADSLVVLIALLCVRFSLLAKIEEDCREIGVMKALGMRVSEIRRLYLASYGALTAVAGAAGFAFALLLYGPMNARIRLNLGVGAEAPRLLLGLAGILLIFLFILLSVGLHLRRFGSLSAAEAVRFGRLGTGGQRARVINPLRLSKNGGLSVNLLLGIRDVWMRRRLYGTILTVVILAAFLIILPQNLYHTVSSEDFVSYMGVGRCDLRIDIGENGPADVGAAEIAAYAAADDAVDRYVVLTTRTLGVKRADGTAENIKVELGDHTVFPVRCADGRMPVSEQEIALSALSAGEWGRAVGDQIILQTPNGERPLTVCGVYSDITNGGKTAKAVFDAGFAPTAWNVVCIGLADQSRLNDKRAEYAARFGFARVSGIAAYVAETFGQTLRSVRLAALILALTAAAVTLLVTLLFLKLLIAKDRYAIALMKALGFPNRDLYRQYMWRIVSVLAVGIAMGTLLAGTLGERLTGAAIALFGAASFRFAVNLPATYLLCPFILLSAALLAVALGASGIGALRISESIKE